MLCFPFTPSAVINIVAGLSKISIYQYGLAVLAGKMMMIFSVSYVGHDIPSLVKNPTKTVIVLVIIFVLWYIGKQIENYMKKKMEEEVEERYKRKRMKQ